MGAELRAWRVSDPATWNAFVEDAPYHAFPQLWEWGEVRAMGGWRPLRLAIGPSPDAPPVAGAQLLLRRLPLLGWHLAYVPRGPIGELDDPGQVPIGRRRCADSGDQGSAFVGRPLGKPQKRITG